MDILSTNPMQLLRSATEKLKKLEQNARTEYILQEYELAVKALKKDGFIDTIAY